MQYESNFYIYFNEAIGWLVQFSEKTRHKYCELTYNETKCLAKLETSKKLKCRENV